MNNIDYINKFRKSFGYAPDYFPKEDAKTIWKDLVHECELKMPTDTQARDREGRAVFIMMASYDSNANEYGKKLGDLLMKHGDYTKEELLNTMEQAANALYQMISNN